MNKETRQAAGYPRDRRVTGIRLWKLILPFALLSSHPQRGERRQEQQLDLLIHQFLSPLLLKSVLGMRFYW